MSEEEEAFEEEPEESVGSSGMAKKPCSALSRVRRDLSDEELSSPGALKLLLDKLDQLELQVAELNQFRSRFHDADKKVAVLDSWLKKENASELLYSFALSSGAIFVGLSPSAWNAQPYGWLSLLLGAVLMGGAVAFKVKRK